VTTSPIICASLYAGMSIETSGALMNYVPPFKDFGADALPP
jgi:hypothetical protein